MPVKYRPVSFIVYLLHTSNQFIKLFIWTFDKINNPPISEYIRNMYQDKNGNFWFGTNGYGVAHFDGDHVSYYSLEQGFGGQQITGITEDSEKNIWFSKQISHNLQFSESHTKVMLQVKKMSKKVRITDTTNTND